MEDRIREIMQKLEEAISYEDFNMVEEARKELLFILDELESDSDELDSDELDSDSYELDSNFKKLDLI